MDENKVSGVSIEQLNNLISKFYDLADRNNKILNYIANICEDSKEYFDTEEGSIYRKHLSNVLSESKTINKNILSYGTDMMNVKKEFLQREKSGSDFLKEEITKIGN